MLTTVSTAPTIRPALVATTALTIASSTPQPVDVIPFRITMTQAPLWLSFAHTPIAVETHQSSTLLSHHVWLHARQGLTLRIAQ